MAAALHSSIITMIARDLLKLLKASGPFWAVVFALWSTIALATARIPPITKFRPNPALKPLRKITCEMIFGPEHQPVISHTLADANREYSRKELLSFVNYLSALRFNVTSAVLTKEGVTVRALLHEKFNIWLDSRKLYNYLRDEFGSVEAAVLKTAEGKKLNRERNDADYKTWSIPILIKIAKEVEKAGLPFERKFLLYNSSLVGMKLAEKYGFPVEGDSIVYRTEKLDLEIEDIREKAGLPAISPNVEKLENLNKIDWNIDYAVDLLKLLQDRGFEMSFTEFQERSDEVEQIFWEAKKRKITVQMLYHHIQRDAGGLVKVKKALGITYDNRGRHVVNAPDWTAPFYIDLLQMISAGGFEISHDLFMNEEKYAPVRSLIKEKTKFDIRGKLIYEYGRIIFGSLREACRRANVRYVHWNDGFIRTRFVEMKPEFTEEKLNPILLVEILKFIESQGYDVTEHLLTTPQAFAPLKSDIQEQFQMEIEGEAIFNAAKSIFKRLGPALIAASVGEKNRERWDEAVLLEASTKVVAKYGFIKKEEMAGKYSEEIGFMLSEDLGFPTSGDSLAEQMRMSIGYQDVMRRAHTRFITQRAWPYAGTPSETFFFEVVEFLVSKGHFLSDSIFHVPGEFDQASADIEEKYGYTISKLSLEKAGIKYGGWAAIREKYGQSYHKPQPELAVNQILPALKEVAAKWPDIKSSTMSTTLSEPIGELLREKFKVRCSGSTLMKMTNAEYGSVINALKLNGHRNAWTRGYPPTQKELMEVLIFLRDEGYTIDRKFLVEEKNFKQAFKKLKIKYGKDITGLAIYQNCFKLYGSDGLTKALDDLARTASGE